MKTMANYLILTEKPSAMCKYAQALGGERGHFADFDYELVAAHGHLLGLAMPEKQWDDVNWQDKVKVWSNIDYVPWPIRRFSWTKSPLPSYGKGTSNQSLLNTIAHKARGKDAIVIATDNDPSGEGDVLGREIVENIGWRGIILRCEAEDEPQAIQQGMQHLKDVTDASRHEAYQKGLARERYDYGTMQLSRLATHSAREVGYGATVRPGRLKSYIVTKIYQQVRARDTFKAEPRYQAVFVDEVGTKYVNGKMVKHGDRVLAENDLSQLKASTVTITGTKRKASKAPRLLDLAQLGAVLSGQLKLKDILSTYQQMYQDQLVSYPRTAERAMTKEQWDQLSRIAPAIADVVGVDRSLLVQTQPRKPYVVDGALDHGANRPGLKVPNSLSEVEGKYGKAGALIYQTVAKSFLATMAPDYEYDQTTAVVTDYPDFKATKNVPAGKPSYKTILGAMEAATKDGDDEEMHNQAQFGHEAHPQVSESMTTPPVKPSEKWILNDLTKQNIGTGATRVSTLSALLQGKQPTLKNGKGQLQLTPEGFVNGAIMQNTMLAGATATKQLTQLMERVGKGTLPMDAIYQALDMTVKKDRAQMDKNAQEMDQDQYLQGKLPRKQGHGARLSGTTKDGEEIQMNKEFMHHTFTPNEFESLLAGNTIEITAKSKAGKTLHPRIKLEHQSFTKAGKKYTYWGPKVVDWGN